MSFDIPLADQMRIALSYVKFKTKQKRLRSDEKVIANTTYGKIKGVKWRNLYGNSEYLSFEGIPFAKPPVGELRFRAPVEPEPWSDVKRCTRVRAKPTQYNIIIKQVQGREDCLYLNVYTKQLNPSKPMPVLVWIYGGGFQMGEASRDLYSPDYIMMENVVLVTIAYRLGPMGFLCLNDEGCDIPGNAGLKDQILALKWVKNNCQFFGGDSNNITIFGESAGGASAHYLMLSERAKGLFQKAVVMSGSALAPWANIPQLDWAYRLAKATGYKGDNNDADVLKHLKHTKASAMMKVSEDLPTMDERHNKRICFNFGPCREPYNTEHCVLPMEPLELLRSNWGNEIPLLIGGNSFEGLIMFSEVRKYPQLLNNLGECECLPPLDAELTEKQREQYGRMLKEMYFGEKEPSWETILEYSDLFSYKYFWHGIHRTLLARQQYAAAPTYLYRFDFDSKHFNFMRIITCGRKVRGTCHADELSYLFYNAGAKKLKLRTAEYQTIRRLVSILVKFAECGNPNIPLTDVAENSALAEEVKNANPLDICSGVADSANIIEIQSNNAEIIMVQETEATSNKKPKPDNDEIDFIVPTNAIIECSISNNSNIANIDKQQSSSIDDNAVEANDATFPTMQQQHHSSQHADATNQSPAVEQYWQPISSNDKIFKCLNISDELEVIDLPEAEKLKLWDNMYENKSLLY